MIGGACDRILILDEQADQPPADVPSPEKAGYAFQVASHLRMPLSAWSRCCSSSVPLTGRAYDACEVPRAWATTEGVTTALPMTERSTRLCNADRTGFDNAGVTQRRAPDDLSLGAFNATITVRRAQASGVNVLETRMPERSDNAVSALAPFVFSYVARLGRNEDRTTNDRIQTRGPASADGRSQLHQIRSSELRPALGEAIGGSKILVRWRGTADGAEPAGVAVLSAAPVRSSRIEIPAGLGRQGAIQVREATREELEGWDDLVMGFDNYRVSHKLAWIRSLQSTVKGRPLFLVYERANLVVGCIPGFLANIGPLRLFGSPLQGWQTVSMGPVFDSSAVSTDELITSLIKFLETRYGVHHVEIISSVMDQQAMQDLGFRSEHLPTYRATLFPDDQDRSIRAMKDSARRNIRRGIKLGLEVKFEQDETFVDEHFDQLREVFARGGFSLPFSKKRAADFFRYMKESGNLIAVSVCLPNNGPNIATGMFTIEGRELLLWMWTHRTGYRWYRPTELMTWSVMKRAMELGCHTFDLMGRGDFKAKFGAELDLTRHRWSRSRYEWLAVSRSLAVQAYKWQQAIRGRMIRWSLIHDHMLPNPRSSETRPSSERENSGSRSASG